MVDLVDMFESSNIEDTAHTTENRGMSSLDFAQAVGLAETFLEEEEEQSIHNIESLFDNKDEEKMHEEAERISLKERNNTQNIPSFERLVMKKCGLI